MSNVPARKNGSGTPRLFSKLVSPAGAAKMEAESRTWIVRCGKCGYERSYWDTGGVIYRGAGTSYKYMKCPNCGKSSWNKVYWPAGVKKSDVYAAALATAKTGPATGAPVALSNRPPVLTWVLLAFVWVALLAGVVILFSFLLFTFVINPLTQPVATAGDNFMNATRAGDYQKAYNLCSPALQKEVGGVSQLAKMFQGNQPAQWNWTTRSITNDVGHLSGPVTFADGAKGTASLTLRQVANEWKLTSFSMNPG